MEKHTGSIDIEFDMPLIRLETMKPKKKKASLLERLSIATKPRHFTLHEDWFIRVDNIEYEPRLNGTIKIPHLEKENEEIVFDGASIPLPWLISLITIGILRPLGVILLGSIIHDYAYTYGHLWVSRSGGTFEKVELDRITADRLLRDTISTANRMPVVGYIGWFFVRIGWITVKYNQETRKGKKPYFEYAVLMAALALFVALGIKFTFTTVVSWLVAMYLVFFVFSIIIG